MSEGRYERPSVNPSLGSGGGVRLVERSDRNRRTGGTGEVPSDPVAKLRWSATKVDPTTTTGYRAGVGTTGGRSLAVFKVNLMLADSAQVADGKLFVLGGGWSMI